MRVNLNYYHDQKSLFFKHYLAKFADEYKIKPEIAAKYIVSGEEGTKEFVKFLNQFKFEAEFYMLRSNSNLYDPGMVNKDDIHSPSFGFVISDDNAALVEFKLKN